MNQHVEPIERVPIPEAHAVPWFTDPEPTEEPGSPTITD